MILTVFHVTVCLSYIIFLKTMDDETIKSNLIFIIRFDFRDTRNNQGLVKWGYQLEKL